MVFSSLQFIFIFMPVFFGFYYAVPNRLKNGVLLIGSLCFYFVGTLSHPEHFILFLVSILIDFFAGLLIERHKKHKRLFLFFGILFHLLALCVFKYLGFIFGEVSRLLPDFDWTVKLILPIGISFYTFQGISYLADVYKGKVSAEKSLLRYFLLWGAVLFLIILTEKFLTGKFLNKVPFIGHLYMLFLIPLTWAIFAVADIGQLTILFTRLFPFFGQGAWSVFRYDYLKYLEQYYPFFIAGILLSAKLPFRILKNLKNRVVIWSILAVLFGASVYCMYRGFDDPFLYFRF